MSSRSAARWRRSHPSFAAAVDPGDVELFLCDLELAGLVAEPLARLERARLLAGARRSSRARRLDPARDRSQRLLTGAWELVDEIEPAPRCLARRVGAGFLLRAPDGELSLVAGDAAAVWDSLSRRPRTFVELLDLLGDAPRARPRASRVEAGVARPRLARPGPDSRPRASRSSAPPAALVDVGRLGTGRCRAAACARSAAWSRPGAAAPCRRRRDWARRRVAPGRRAARPSTSRSCASTESRTWRRGSSPTRSGASRACAASTPDLVILAGGGRHGGSELREAESVIDRYRCAASRVERSGWRSTPPPPGRTCSGASRCSRRARSRPGASRSSAIARAPRSSAWRASSPGTGSRSSATPRSAWCR